MDDSIVVRAKEYMLSAPVVAPKNAGSNFCWEQLLISDRLLLLRRNPGPSEPEAL